MGLIEFTGGLGQLRQGHLTPLSKQAKYPRHAHLLQEPPPPQQGFSAEHSASLHLADSCPALRFFQFSSVTHSCPTLRSHELQHARPPCPSPTPGVTQTHVHWVSDAIQPSHPLLSPVSSCLQYFPASGSFPMSRFLASGGQSIGSSGSASVLPVNIQDWFPLGWTGWISLQSKGFSRNSLCLLLPWSTGMLASASVCFPCSGLVNSEESWDQQVKHKKFSPWCHEQAFHTDQVCQPPCLVPPQVLRPQARLGSLQFWGCGCITQHDAETVWASDRLFGWKGREAHIRGGLSPGGDSQASVTGEETPRRLTPAPAHLPRQSAGLGETLASAFAMNFSHPSTNQARPCLASEIRQDRACSGWCGRRLLWTSYLGCCCHGLRFPGFSQPRRLGGKGAG